MARRLRTTASNLQSGAARDLHSSELMQASKTGFEHWPSGISRSGTTQHARFSLEESLPPVQLLQVCRVGVLTRGCTEHLPCEFSQLQASLNYINHTSKQSLLVK